MHHRAQQSPIDLADPIVTNYGAGRLRVSWSKNLKGETVEDSHGGKKKVVFNGNQKDDIILEGERYCIANFHFHWKSEHWVNGRQQQMELHIVHQSPAGSNGSRAVLGIFIEPTKSAAAKKRTQNKWIDEGEVSTNPHLWLPSDIEHYYRYEGSLTTHPYDENVHWLVFREPLRVPRQVFNLLKRDYAASARLPQPWNRRFLLANF